MKYVTELYDRRLNEEIWIAGAGPSIDTFPDSFMDNKLGIVLHSAYLKFPNAQYRHANESDRVEWFKANRPEYLNGMCIFAFPFFDKTQLQTEAIVDVDRDNYYFFILRANSPNANDADWVTEKVARVRAGGVMDFGGHSTCLHACVYACVVMGCNPINVIGCEHKAEPGKAEYFRQAQEMHTSRSQKRRNHITLGPRQEPGTLALIEAAGRNGITINRYFGYHQEMG